MIAILQEAALGKESKAAVAAKREDGGWTDTHAEAFTPAG